MQKSEPWATFRLKTCLFFFLCTLTLITLINGQLQAQTLTAGQHKLKVATGNHKDVTLQSILSGIPVREQFITARIYLPSDCTGDKKPAVIIQHGSGAPKASHYKKLAKKLNEVGIIAIVPDLYSARGIRETATDQSRLSWGARVNDVFSVFRQLHKIPCVDSQRVGITGYSVGGSMAIEVVERKFSNLLGGGHHFKASMPVYPYCLRRHSSSNPTKTKVQLILAENDDYTPAKHCVDSAKYWKNRGWSISYEIIPNVHHGFISDSPQKYLPNVWTAQDCGWLYIENNGTLTSEDLGINFTDDWKSLVKFAQNNGCLRKGVTSGNSGKNAEVLREMTVNFFQKNL
jgi:dienelactone hydrolase